jgi:hypothetical protein
MLPQRNARTYELAMQTPQKSFANKIGPEPVAAPAQTRARVVAQNAPAAAKELPADSLAANYRQPEPQPLLAYDAPGQKARVDDLATTARKDSAVRDEAKPASPAPPSVALAAAPPPAIPGGTSKKADELRSNFGSEPASESKTLALAASAGTLPTERAHLKSEKTPGTPLTQSAPNEASKTVYRFVQAPSGPGGLLDKTAAPVLASFDFEQSGSRIRIVDADGSVYAGTLSAPQTAQAVAPHGTTSGRLLSDSSMTFSRATAGLTETDKESGAAFSFQVEGTNQTLKQKVVLTGALFNDAQSTDRRGAEVVTNSVLQITPGKPVLLGQPTMTKPVSRISGKATIGGAGFDINAVQAP